MNDYAVETIQVDRYFAKVVAVRDLNLRVPRGSLCGLLGRNAAGKSTVMRMLAGLIKPHCGRVLVHGGDPFIFNAEQRAALGYVPERIVLPLFLTAEKLIKFFARLQVNYDSTQATGLLAKLEINPRRKIGELSLGQQKIVSFVLAVAQRPTVLLLDEPSANLDAVARRIMLDAVLELAREQGTTVLLSTHILSDIERVADQIAIIAHGTLKIADSLDRLKETIKRVRIVGPHEALAGVVVPASFSLRRAETEIEAVMSLDNEEALAQSLRAAGCSYEANPLSLEDIFVEVAGP